MNTTTLAFPAGGTYTLLAHPADTALYRHVSYHIGGLGYVTIAEPVSGDGPRYRHEYRDGWHWIEIEELPQ